MWISAPVIVCLLAAVLALDETKSKKTVDLRGKRNLEYTITHNYPTSQNHRTERRISTGPQLQRYSPFFPGPRPSYTQYRKGRPHSLPPPPYAVQMEPLVHYSQRDPLYDTNTLPLIADNDNEPSKAEDLLTENTNNHIENVYGPPAKYIERPVYIKEPEPIIEIIIKESNVSLPPVYTAPVTPAPKKKEQVQVFYVKYKKNPNGHGKDSIIYDKPVPAISPVIDDEHEEEPPQAQYGPPEIVTSAPPPSTTLRTIIKPDSETYHSPSGIKVTFGKEGFDYDKRSPKKGDDVKEESAPEPTVAHPQARQFPLPQINTQRRQPVVAPNFQSSSNYRPEFVRFPQPQAYRTLPQSLTRPFQYKSIHTTQNKQIFSQTQPKFSQQIKLSSQFQSPVPTKSPLPQFNQPFSNLQQEFYFNAPRQPVPYQPFPQLRPQQPLPSPPSPPTQSPQQQFEFPPPHTHFPVLQQTPLVQQQNVFNQQLAQRQKQQQLQINLQPQQQQQQRLPHFEANQFFKEQPTAPPQIQFLQKPNTLAAVQQNSQQQLQYSHQFNNQPPHLNQGHLQQPQQIIPPGGELVPSLAKYEQHISVPVEASQQQTLQSHQQQQFQQQQQQQQLQQQQQQLQQHLQQEQYKQQIQQQFSQPQTQSAQREPHFIQGNPSLQSSTQNQHRANQNYADKLVYHTTSRPAPSKPIYVSSSTTTTTERPTSPRPEPPKENKKDDKALAAQLPDEVPDELRQQLLSSGILSNADISVLDYDKVGDIPLSALPPDQLANFYNAGGAQQIAGSEPVPLYTDTEGKRLSDSGKHAQEVDQDTDASESEEVKVQAPVQMKVVHYDPETEQGQKVQESYVKDTAQQVEPVVLDDQTYNKYLPLKVNGAEFPIPDVPELKGKNITSVVVLAPVKYKVKERQTRDTEVLAEEIQFVTENLKELLKNPTRENYNKFLENENNTTSDKQAVILLVTGSEDTKDKEIYMYDIATKTVSKLNGELSAAFVEAAESNVDEEKDITASTNIIETRIPYPEDRIDLESGSHIVSDELADSASEYVESKVPIIDPTQTDLETEASEQLESFVDISGMPVQDDLTAAASDNLSNQVSISSGYSRTEINNSVQ